MSDRLPPLTALRAFEAAARHLSFAKAAEELNVTPAALSFQIKNLEDHLGQPLFRRRNRAVDLTEAGRVLSPGASDGFERLAEAWRSTRRLQDQRTLVVTAGPAFTAKWLAPRLYAFAQAHQEIELRFSATLKMMDFDRDEVDVAVRYGLGSDPGMFSKPMLAEAITPMMRPDMQADFPTPASLAGAALFHDGSIDFLDPCPDWPAWFHVNGLPPPPAPAARFSQADHALDAALAGGGVVLTRTSLAVHYLALGQLVAPFDMAFATDARFRMLCKQGTQNRPQIAAFMSWMMNEVESVPDGLQGKTLIRVEDIA